MFVPRAARSHAIGAGHCTRPYDGFFFQAVSAQLHALLPCYFKLFAAATTLLNCSTRRVLLLPAQTGS